MDPKGGGGDGLFGLSIVLSERFVARRGPYKCVRLIDCTLSHPVILDLTDFV